MTWLYKGVYSQTDQGLKAEVNPLGFLAFPLKMLLALQSANVTPICVFDGNYLLAKHETNMSRSKAKLEARETANQLIEMGEDEAAKKYIAKSLILKADMINLLIDILRAIKIEFVIAPYEADAQMAYMVKEGLADIAISEDSDLIVYGCPVVLTKMTMNGYFTTFR